MEHLNYDRVSFRGGGGGGGIRPPLAGCLPPLEILLYTYCIVQHVALAPPGMRKQLFCPPWSKILNAALYEVCLSYPSKLLPGHMGRGEGEGVLPCYTIG